MPTPEPRVTAFHQLHESGCFVIPNPYDVGTARLLEQLGFNALATSSAGFAWTLGRPDNGVTLDEALAHYTAVAAAVRVPVSADFERAYATEPEEVAANVTRACATGLAGLSVEDSTHVADEPLFAFELAVERMRAARRAIDATGTGLLLVGRSEGFIAGRPDLRETIRRLEAYAEAGADCLFAPGITSLDDVRAIVRAVAPKPVNVVVGSNWTTVEQLADAGVRRVSVGGGLTRAALTTFLATAREIREHGRFDLLAQAMPGKEVDAKFR